MIAFRLFREYRDLEAALVKLESQLASVSAERDFLRAENTRLRDEHASDLRKTADAFAFLNSRRNVFARADAPDEAMLAQARLRADMTANPAGSRKMLARELVLRKNAETQAALNQQRNANASETFESLERLFKETTDLNGPNG